MVEQQYGQTGKGMQFNQSSSEPLSVGQYVVLFIIQLIPIVNIIMLFVWAFGGNVNQNKRNYAKAMLIFWVIGIVLGIIFSIAMGGILSGIMGGTYGLGA
jgi:hypothetical protein